jgi:hypothetical protein
VAQLFFDVSHYEDALACHEQALEMLGDLAAQEPRDPHVLTHRLLGLHLQRACLHAAEAGLLALDAGPPVAEEPLAEPPFSPSAGSPAIHAPVKFGGPECQVVGRVDMGVVPGELPHALLVGQPRPAGPLLAQVAGEDFVIPFGVDAVAGPIPSGPAGGRIDTRRKLGVGVGPTHGSIISSGTVTSASSSDVAATSAVARWRPRS